MFHAALSRAWVEMKRRAANRAQCLAACTVARSADAIRSDILTLERKDKLRGGDWQRLDTLRTKLNAAYSIAA